MLKTLRTKKGYTEKLLAKKIGISQGYLSKLENHKIHKNGIPMGIILKLAKELDICPLKLFIYFSGADIKCKLNCHKCFKTQNKP